MQSPVAGGLLPGQVLRPALSARCGQSQTATNPFGGLGLRLLNQ